MLPIHDKRNAAESLVMDKACTQCGSNGPFFNSRIASDGLDYWCKQCRKAANTEWRKKNPEQYRKLGRKNQFDRYTRLKRELVEAYGGACQCCGETDLHFLTLEHWQGVPEHHKRNGRRLTGLMLLQAVKSEGYPDEYGVLCMNCNCARGHYGFCPHQPHDEASRRY